MCSVTKVPEMFKHNVKIILKYFKEYFMFKYYLLDVSFPPLSSCIHSSPVGGSIAL